MIDNVSGGFDEIKAKLNINNVKSILVKGANVIKREAQSLLLRKVNSYATRAYITKGGKMKTYSLKKGVKSTKYKHSNDAVAATHLMGDFRLKFFEMGTADRYTKSGAYRGRIDKNKFHFFDTSVSSKESEAYKIILEGLEKLIIL